MNDDGSGATTNIKPEWVVENNPKTVRAAAAANTPAAIAQGRAENAERNAALDSARYEAIDRLAVQAGVGVDSAMRAHGIRTALGDVREARIIERAVQEAAKDGLIPDSIGSLRISNQGVQFVNEQETKQNKIAASIGRSLEASGVVLGEADVVRLNLAARNVYEARQHSSEQRSSKLP